MIIITIVYSGSCKNLIDKKRESADTLNPQSQKLDALINHKKGNTIAHLFDTMLCNGFDFPVGNVNGQGNYVDLKTNQQFTGWYKAVDFCEEYMYGLHPGEDWNGIGGGNTDLGQPIYAIGKGVVVAAENAGSNWGKSVVIEHKYYENGKVQKIRSIYVHLDTMMVQKGDYVERRQEIGTLGNNFGMFYAHLHFEIRRESLFEEAITYWPPADTANILRDFEHPTGFIESHRKILNLSHDSLLVVAVKNEYKIYLCKDDSIVNTFPIGLGQSSIGHKAVQGDNKTPEGEYFINEKSLGPFGGTWGDYFGPAWIRVSYPNTFDASVGLANNSITQTEFDAIEKATIDKAFPLKNTALGGGIGIHGWIEQWDTTLNNDLTWGCISINNNQLLDFYNAVPIGTRIVILP